MKICLVSVCFLLTGIVSAMPLHLGQSQPVTPDSSGITFLPGQAVEVTYGEKGCEVVEEPVITSTIPSITMPKVDEPKEIGLGATQAMTLSLLLMDWGQTRYMVQNTDRDELNPVLGRRPSTGQVDTHFAIGTGLFLLFQTRPPKERDSFNKTLMFLESVCVTSNGRTGLGYRLPF